MENNDLNTLIEFLKIKSISMQKEYLPDMKNARDFLLGIFKSLGFKTKLLKGEIHDLVYAEKIIDKRLPTMLIYGHYDVQPPDPLNEWKTDPFKPTEVGGNLYARGTSDDKGQIMANIMAGKKLIEKYGKDIPINLKYIIEGEEEVGSVSIPEVADKFSKDLFKCDYLLVSDSEMLAPGRPTIDINLRGLTYMEVSLQTAAHDLHSGAYGGVAENPAILLAKIIAKLKDDKGRVLIPDFYKDVALPTEKELNDFAKIKTTKSQLKDEGEFYLIGGGEPKYDLNERRWTRPTLDINGLTSGYQGEGSKTIIPAKASAKISMRLVPNQDPKNIAKLFKKYIKGLVPNGIKLQITEHSGAYPYKAPTGDPVFELTKACLNKSFGGKTMFNGVGGSIGFVPVVAEKLRIPCIMIGFGLPTDNIHAPNEHILISNYLNGISAVTELLEKIPTINAKK